MFFCRDEVLHRLLSGSENQKYKFFYSTYTFHTSMANFTPPKLSSRFQMSYKEDEREFYEEIENNLMQVLHITKRCDLHKKAVKVLEQVVKSQTLSLL